MSFIINVFPDINYITLKDRCPRCESKNIAQYSEIEDNGEDYVVYLECKDCRFDFSAKFKRVAEIPMKSEEYLDNGGCLCPVCRSDNIGTMHCVETDSLVGWQEVECYDCGAEWMDHYRLIGYTLKEE
jgi:hypothetical protein